MPTIGGTVAQNARRVPHREALVTPQERRSWARLAGDVGRVAGVLAGAGLRHGDRFAIMAANSAEYVIAVLAVLRLGAVVVPVGARLAPPEVAHLLRDSGAAMVAAGAECRPVLDSALGTDRRVRRWALAELCAARPATGEIHDDRAVESDNAFITYTSGTTGRPKGVLIDHHRAIWAALAQITSMGLRDGERYLHLSPLHHSGGVVFLNAVTLLAGTHVIGPAFEPAAVLDTLARESITAFLGVPTMYQMLLRQPDIGARDLSGWRTAIFGAAPMPATTITELLRRFPAVALFQLCGQTESGPVGLYSTTEQLRARPDSTGHQAQPGVAHRVVGRDGTDVGVGQVGELLFRGESVMKGYWNRPQETTEAIVAGWLHTGDLVRVDPDGALVLVDRLKDMIITGGQNVYSAEVEQALATHPAVADCAVIGVPHADYGATVVAVVTPRDGMAVTLASLQEHCRDRIARYKIPRELVLGAVPRNATGKLQKHLLRPGGGQSEKGQASTP